MSEPYVGEIRIAAFNFAPQGWAFCDGSLISIADNDTLFNLIGTTYGGDGQNNFALPDLRGRIPMHFGAGFPLADRAGVESSIVNPSQLPIHNHAFLAATTPATSSSPSGAKLGATAANVYRAPTTIVGMSSTTTNGPGQSLPHDNMMPFLCVNFIISLFGVYPSQN